MKKIIISLLILILSIFAIPSIGNVFAEEEQTSSQTIIYPVFNDLSGEYLDLSNINLFDINNSTLIYSTKSGATDDIHIYDLKTHAFIKSLTYENVKYLKIANNYLFVLSNNQLKIISLTDYLEYSLGGYSISNNITSIAIDSNSSTITICYISNNKLIRLFVNNSLNLISSSQTSSEIAEYFGAIALSKTHAYVTYGDTSDINKLVMIDLETTSIPGSNSYSYFPQGVSSNLVFFEDSTNSYVISIAKFTDNSTISLIRTNLNQGESADFQAGNEAVNDNGVYELNSITFPTDVKIINNEIYIADKGSKTIRKFNVVMQENAKLSATKIIVASEFAENGWYSNNVDILSTTTNEIYFADYKNNRVQTIKNGVLKTISSENEYYHKNIEVTTEQTIFYSFKTEKAATNSNIAVISNSNKTIFTQYIKNNNIIIELTNIHSSTTANNTFYALVDEGIIYYDKTSEKLKLVDGLPQVFKNFNNNSIIEYIPAHNVFAIFNNSNLYLTNNNFELLNSTPTQLSNIKTIATTQNHIYTLSNNQINKYSINYDSNTLRLEGSISNDSFKNINSISTNKKSGVIYGFNSKTCCIESIIDCNFNLYRTFSKAIALNLNVATYSKPTTLPVQDSSIIHGRFKLGALIDLYSTEIINFAGNKFYAVIINSNIYYVNVNDVDIYSAERIVYYKAPNAKINASSNINVYASNNKSEIIDEIAPNTDIITINYNEANEFTKIQYYNSYNELCEGWISTDYIKTFNLSQSEIIAIALIGVSVPIIILIFALYIKISKKKKN